MSASSSANTVCGETLSTHRSRDVPARQRAVGPARRLYPGTSSMLFAPLHIRSS
ncbi:hypothetical protein I553_1250 [Mycobacterium xenopi 4042]|uniref:Uncharacterized protein n=1 Tax=Mycobacterium xenopi 4042 TaxID=1299334 RepID=X7ZCJ5_MYCXE|nr:hypothetical protein I553_1250 [Mycobacterium xenopi 4042]